MPRRVGRCRVIPQLDPKLLRQVLLELPDRRWAALLTERFGLDAPPEQASALRLRYYPDLDELAFRRRLKAVEAEVLGRMAQLMSRPE